MLDVTATLLIQSHGSGGHSAFVVRSGGDVYHDIGEGITRSFHRGFGLWWIRSGIILRASGFLGHVDDLLLWHRAIHSDLPGDRPCETTRWSDQQGECCCTNLLHSH